MITIKKIITVISITIIFSLFFSIDNVYAAAVAYNNAVWLYGTITGSASGAKRWYLVNSQGNNGQVILDKTNSQIYFSGPIYDADVGVLEGNSVSSPYLYYIESYVLGGAYISYVGSGQPDLSGFDSVQDYEDYINPPPEPDSWYEILWSDFTHWIDEIGDTLSDGFEDFINWISGESTHGGGHDFRIPDTVRPSPIPTPVPPAPYETIIVPKTDPDTGNTYYDIQYVYNNPSGTPIITGVPPQNDVNVTDNDNDFEYPYYNNPDNRNNPYYFDMPWYLKFINGTNVFDLDDMSDNLDVMETAINDDTISNGVTSAYSSMATLPTDWIQLVGIIASIPLIGCLIARFLKG